MFIKIKVKTGSRTEKVEKKSDDLYLVSVKEKAERNMANKSDPRNHEEFSFPK